jgi:hypothetical protein
MAKKLKAGATLDETNFQEFARRIIEKYEERRMPVDLMLWSRIIDLYDAALEKAKAASGVNSRGADPSPAKR